ncbi:MAG: ThuA domain-containing protein, partial [Acidobacteriota bacterium]
QALGRDGIYFDYVTTVEEALGDANYLNRFDALLLYANHQTIKPHQWENLKNFVEKEGKGFVPVHSASWCFQNEPGYDQLVGGRFQKHKSGVFTPRIIKPKHAAMDGVNEFEAWDETYVHTRHNPKSRTVLMVRDPMKGELLLRPEPWTWVRTQGKGRVFYTASGHDERVWGNSGFHQMMKAGILWSIGEERRAASIELARSHVSCDPLPRTTPRDPGADRAPRRRSQAIDSSRGYRSPR